VITLGARIARLIRAQGPLTVAQFMTIALHDPQDGYYATRDPLGARGDFVTSPEISQVFGELAGLWAVQTWIDQARPAGPRLVELGPGRGTLLRDALRAMSIVPDFVVQAQIELVEASPVLRDVQRETLAPWSAQISWRDKFEADARPLFLLANEFFDALPVRQFQRVADGWHERVVLAREDDALAFALTPHRVPLALDAPDGAILETAPAAEALCEAVAGHIAAQGGAALLVDYGYDVQAFAPTLQAVARHTFSDVLAAPGEADLSAHVDFTTLAATARRSGAAVFGPVPQGAFLEAMGIRERTARLAARNPGEAARLESATNRLVDPHAMGELFRVMAILPPSAPHPPGF
jgi:SAM-dependent MidA family methyltransferase